MAPKQNDPLYLRKGLWALAAAYREIEDRETVKLMVECAECIGVISGAGLNAMDPPESVVASHWKSYRDILQNIKQTATQWGAFDGSNRFPYVRVPNMKENSREVSQFKHCCELAYKCHGCLQSIVQAAKQYGIATKPPRFPSEFSEKALTEFYTQLMGFMPDGAYSVTNAGCMSGIYVPDGKDKYRNPIFKRHHGGEESAGATSYFMKMQGRMWTIVGQDDIVRFENRAPVKRPPGQGWKPSNHPEAKGRPCVNMLQAGGKRSMW